jgi:L-iditol 2-dehydrogenase
MRAAVIRAPMDFGVEDVPVPDCPPGGFLLKVHACGLCGSDLRTLRSGHHRVTLPWIVGHEVSGTVAEVGEGYAGEWGVGEMLSVGPLVFCGECRFCARGRPELCERYREIAQAWPGGFAEYLAVPPEAVAHGTIARVPEGLDPAVAAIAEPVSSCVHAQEKGAVAAGDAVVVIGAGPVGCTHVSLARSHGAGPVIIADVNPARLELAAAFGPDHIVNSAQADLVAEVRRLTDRRGADVVVTANPVPETQVQAVEMAAKGGRVLVFGGLPKDRACPGINTNLIHYNALSVIGTTIFAPRHQQRALALLASGAVPGDRLITHRFALDEFAEGAGLALEGKVLKAVFLP